MAVFLLKLIFLALITLSNLVSRLIFTATAHFLVLFIQALRVPGQAFQGVLEQVGNFIKLCLEYFVELMIKAATSAISSLFDLLKEGVSGSAVATTSAIGELLEKSRTSLDGLLKDIPEVVEVFTDMTSTILKDLWNNSKDAIGYIIENAV